jgi:hypothetical protein
MATVLTNISNGGGTTRYKGKQINVPHPESLAKNTLDATHKSRIKFFKDEKRSLSSKKAQVIDLQKELEQLNQVEPYTRDYQRIISIEDKISELKKEIEYVESGKAELEYYSKAGELLIEFYDNISATKNSESKFSKANKKKEERPNKSIYDLFMQPSVSESVKSYIAEQKALEAGSATNSNYEASNFDDFENEMDGVEVDPVLSRNYSFANKEETRLNERTKANIATLNSQEAGVKASSGLSVNSTEQSTVKTPVDKKTGKGRYHKLTDFVEKEEGFKRADFFGEYLNIIDPHYVPEEEALSKESQSEAYCEDCGCYRNINPADATMVCPKCSSYVVVVIDSDKPNYKDPPAEISNFPYRRINHFNECLSQFQAKESTEIPQIVYDIILMEMKKERLTNMAQLTREKVHTYLKKQANKKFTNYYEHIPHIIHRLTGIQPKTMTPKMEEELRRDFHKIQEPYAKHKPKNRKNFLNYNYVLHKLCQIRALNDKDYKEFLSCFPLLKSRDKLLQQDIVWRKICQDLGWRFIKSV